LKKKKKMDTKKNSVMIFHQRMMQAGKKEKDPILEEELAWDKDKPQMDNG
jgi:hypothetical protein